jgi:hypothetical protein
MRDWIEASIAARERGELLDFPLCAKINVRIYGEAPVHSLRTMRSIFRRIIAKTEPFFLDYSGDESGRDFLLHMMPDNHKQVMTWLRMRGFDTLINEGMSTTRVGDNLIDRPSYYHYATWEEPTDPFATIVRTLKVMSK